VDKQCNAVLILHVNTVRVLSNHDGGLRIACAGEAASTGWTRPAVRPQCPPENDNVLHLDFIAVAPNGPAAQMIEEVCVEYHCTNTEGLTGIRIHSETNSIFLPLPPE